MTDWELGNSLMCNVVDKMKEISNECEKKNPLIADLLQKIAMDFGVLVNDLMSHGDSKSIRMCPEDTECYTYFDGNSIYEKDKTKPRVF